MKKLVSVITLVAAMAFTGAAFAGDPKADCEASGGTWDAANSACK